MEYPKAFIERIPLPESMPLSQTTDFEKRLLYWLAKDYYRGEGLIVDAGCLVGGSTFHLLRGLAENQRDIPKARRVHAFDAFPGDNLERFKANLAGFEPHLAAHAGNLGCSRITEPVEILFVDIAKTAQTWQIVCDMFFGRLIPGRSVVYQQDFSRARLPWLHYSTGYLLPLIDVVDPDFRSFFYVTKSALPAEALERLRRDDFCLSERLDLVRSMEQFLPGDAQSAAQWKAILDLSCAYVEHYFGDRRTALAQAQALSKDPYLNSQFPGMFGELGVEGFIFYHFNHANHLADGNRLEEAVEELKKCLKLLDNGQSGNRNFVTRAQILARLGECLFLDSQLQEAEVCLDKAIKLAPKNQHFKNALRATLLAKRLRTG